MIFVIVAIREESFSGKIRRKEGKRERKERKEHVQLGILIGGEECGDL